MKITFPQRIYAEEAQPIDLPDLFNREKSDGLLIVIEGIDGTGKTTLATALASNISRIFPGVVLTSEPTGSYNRLPKKVFEDDISRMAMDHAIHLGRIVIPALIAGNLVISDRWSWSSYAYQGDTPQNYALVKASHDWDYRPDLTILLDMPVSSAMERIKKRGYPTEEYESERFLDGVRERYREMIAPDWVVVYADRDFNDLFHICTVEMIKAIRRHRRML